MGERAPFFHSGAFLAGCGLLHHELRARRSLPVAAALAVGVDELLALADAASSFKPDVAAGLRLSATVVSFVALMPLDDATTAAVDDSDTGGAASLAAAALLAARAGESTLPPPAFFRSTKPRSLSTMWRADTTRFEGDRKFDSSVGSTNMLESATSALALIGASAEAAASGGAEDENEAEVDLDEKCAGAIDKENEGAGTDAFETVGMGVETSR
jgi:hypothetical protein